MSGAGLHGVGLMGMVSAALLAGWIATRLVRRPMSLFAALLLGLAGAGLGGAIAQGLGLRFEGLLAGFVISAVGATLILAVAILAARRR